MSAFRRTRPCPAKAGAVSPFLRRSHLKCTEGRSEALDGQTHGVPAGRAVQPERFGAPTCGYAAYLQGLGSSRRQSAFGAGAPEPGMPVRRPLPADDVNLTTSGTRLVLPREAGTSGIAVRDGHEVQVELRAPAPVCDRPRSVRRARGLQEEGPLPLWTLRPPRAPRGRARRLRRIRLLLRPHLPQARRRARVCGTRCHASRAATTFGTWRRARAMPNTSARGAVIPSASPSLPGPRASRRRLTRSKHDAHVVDETVLEDSHGLAVLFDPVELDPRDAPVHAVGVAHGDLYRRAALVRHS